MEPTFGFVGVENLGHPIRVNPVGPIWTTCAKELCYFRGQPEREPMTGSQARSPNSRVFFIKTANCAGENKPPIAQGLETRAPAPKGGAVHPTHHVELHLPAVAVECQVVLPD